jgi:hypothetical protein
MRRKAQVRNPSDRARVIVLTNQKARCWNCPAGRSARANVDLSGLAITLK